MIAVQRKAVPCQKLRLPRLPAAQQIYLLIVKYTVAGITEKQEKLFIRKNDLGAGTQTDALFVRQFPAIH